MIPLPDRLAPPQVEPARPGLPKSGSKRGWSGTAPCRILMAIGWQSPQFKPPSSPLSLELRELGQAHHQEFLQEAECTRLNQALGLEKASHTRLHLTVPKHLSKRKAWKTLRWGSTTTSDSLTNHTY